METLEFTTDEVMEALVAVVEEKPEDYRYEWGEDTPNGPCYYARQISGGGGVPRCIVGHVIHRLSPEWFKVLAAQEDFIHTFDALSAVLGPEIDAMADEVPAELATRTKIKMPLEAMVALLAAQRTQDVGRTWREALENAENLVQMGPDPDSPLYREAEARLISQARAEQYL